MKDTLAFQITALYRDFLTYTTGELKRLGLSFGQLPLLIFVGKNPGCPQSQLTKELKLDWGYSQRSVTKLEETGFLTKVPDEKAACNRLTLTDRGEEAFAVCHQVFYTWDRDRTGSLSPEEQENLAGLLKKLAAGAAAETKGEHV